MARRCFALAILVLVCTSTLSLAQPPQPIVRNPDNPPLFQRFAAPPSGIMRFMLSDRGRQILRRSRTPGAIAILKALGENVTEPRRPGLQYPLKDFSPSLKRR
jgi:hypothetical protein